jgi:glycosyltransferase involved in cell wall biosynthesis
MISFIVIGKNEGSKLLTCINSIYKSIELCKLSSYEIIFVDSNSSDNSIDLVSKFNEVKIFKLTGKCNAALARNTGAFESKGEILFFIDGDMELYPSFLQNVMLDGYHLLYPFVTGNLINIVHDSDSRLIEKSLWFENKNGSTDNTPVAPGFFLIERKLWLSVNGMRTKYKSAEDPDFGLRLARSGHLLVRRNEILGIHNTISYHDDKRFWNRLKNGIPFYEMVLLRDHLFNPWASKLFLRRHWSLFYLMVMIIISYTINSILPLGTYLIIVIMRSMIGKNLRKQFVKSSLRIIIIEILSIFALFFFFPRDIQSGYFQLN